MTRRLCSRVTCQEPAVQTLTYVYADSMAVLGPLSLKPEPHSYDLCSVHAERQTAPQGWSVLRIAPPEPDPEPEPEPEPVPAKKPRTRKAPLRRV